jgi:hypothetical protein
MGSSSGKKTRVAKIDLKNLKMLSQLAQKTGTSAAKNDYFFQRMLSTNSNQTLQTNQSN